MPELKNPTDSSTVILSISSNVKFRQYWLHLAHFQPLCCLNCQSQKTLASLMIGCQLSIRKKGREHGWVIYHCRYHDDLHVQDNPTYMLIHALQFLLIVFHLLIRAWDSASWALPSAGIKMEGVFLELFNIVKMKGRLRIRVFNRQKQGLSLKCSAWKVFNPRFQWKSPSPQQMLGPKNILCPKKGNFGS